jgi:hypothetical protein
VPFLLADVHAIHAPRPPLRPSLERDGIIGWDDWPTSPGCIVAVAVSTRRTRQAAMLPRRWHIGFHAPVLVHADDAPGHGHAPVWWRLARRTTPRTELHQWRVQEIMAITLAGHRSSIPLVDQSVSPVVGSTRRMRPRTEAREHTTASTSRVVCKGVVSHAPCSFATLMALPHAPYDREMLRRARVPVFVMVSGVRVARTRSSAASDRDATNALPHGGGPSRYTSLAKVVVSHREILFHDVERTIS